MEKQDIKKVLELTYKLYYNVYNSIPEADIGFSNITKDQMIAIANVKQYVFKRKYMVNGEEYDEKYFYDTLNDECEEASYEIFDEYLDDTYNSITIKGRYFSASDILKNMDDYLYGDLKEDFDNDYKQTMTDNVENGEFITVNGTDFQIMDAED